MVVLSTAMSYHLCTAWERLIYYPHTFFQTWCLFALFISPASDIGKNLFVSYAKCATVSCKFAIVEITTNTVAYNEGKSLVYRISHGYTTILPILTVQNVDKRQARVP